MTQCKTKSQKRIKKRHFHALTLLCLLSVAGVSGVRSQAILYPAPAGLKPAPDFQVSIDGRPAFVYASPIPASFCSFDLLGPVTVVIKANRDVRWVDVRPFSAHVKPEFHDSTIVLHLRKPQKLSIEVNGLLQSPLFLFANPKETGKPSPTDTNVIYFAAGKQYTAGIIRLKSNQSLYVEGGAVVTGVVQANDATHVRVFGRGILDGTFNNRLSDSLMKAGNLSADAPASDRRWTRFLEFNNCTDVRIDDITLLNSTSWQVVPIHCSGVRITNIKVVSDQGSDDGTDLVRCRHVVIDNCFYRTKDDCIAVKAHLDYPSSEGVEDIVVKNSIFWNALWGNALEIGFELNAAAVHNLRFENLDVIHVEKGAVISIHNAGPARVSDVSYNNIRIEDARQKLFDLAIFRSRYSPEMESKSDHYFDSLYLNGVWDNVLRVPADEKAAAARVRGSIANIRFTNIQLVAGLTPFSTFSGFDEAHAVKTIRISDMRFHGRRVMNIRDARIYATNTSDIKIE